MAKTKTAEVLELPVEEIKPTDDNVLEKEISTTLVKYNVTDNVLNDLIKKHKDLTIKDTSDKEGYEAVHEARMEFANMRVLIGKVCKHGREDAVIIQKKWIATENKLVARISPDEERLKKMEKDYEAEKERKKQERLEMERARIRVRVTELQSMGAISDGIDVYLDEVSFSITDIREAEEEDYQSDILPLYKTIFDAKEKVRLELEEQKRIDQKKLDDEREEFERQKRQLQQQKDELENQKKEAALKIRNTRIAQVESLGMKPNYPSGDYTYDTVIVPLMHIDLLSDGDWELTYADAARTIADIKKYQEEEKQRLENERLENARKKAAAELLVKERIAQLNGMHFGMDMSDQFTLYRGLPNVSGSQHVKRDDIEMAPEENWIEIILNLKKYAEYADQEIAKKLKEKILNEEKENREKLKQQQEEQADLASDKDKWVAFMSELNNVKIPVMKRQPYKEYVETATAMIKKINAIKK